jgi:hypothetical protein
VANTGDYSKGEGNLPNVKENMNILITILCFLLCFAFYLLWRNHKVFKFRNILLDVILDSPSTYWKNIEYFKTINYNTMVYTFWRPVKSFYDLNKFKFTEEDKK